MKTLSFILLRYNRHFTLFIKDTQDISLRLKMIWYTHMIGESDKLVYLVHEILK